MHVNVPITLVVVGTFVVLLALVYLARQFLVSRRQGSFECTLWRRAITGREGWQLGLMRYRTDRLRWYRAFSLGLRPEVTIRRDEIADIDRGPVVPRAGGADAYVVLDLLLTDGRTRRMLMARSSSAGLLAWLEAAPAGYVITGAD